MAGKWINDCFVPDRAPPGTRSLYGLEDRRWRARARSLSTRDRGCRGRRQGRCELVSGRLKWAQPVPCNDPSRVGRNPTNPVNPVPQTLRPPPVVSAARSRTPSSSMTVSPHTERPTAASFGTADEIRHVCLPVDNGPSVDAVAESAGPSGSPTPISPTVNAWACCFRVAPCSSCSSSAAGD